jgi:hypothetical protein
VPDSTDIPVTPEGYRISEQELADSAVVLVFNPAGDAHVYVRTGVSPADVLELVLGFAHQTVERHFGSYSPSGKVIDG